MVLGHVSALSGETKDIMAVRSFPELDPIGSPRSSCRFRIVKMIETHQFGLARTAVLPHPGELNMTGNKFRILPSTVAPCSRRWRCFQPYPSRSCPSPRRPRPQFERRIALVERRTGKTGDPRFRPRHHGTGQARNLCLPEERIATFDQDGTLWVEHPDLWPNDVLPRPGPGVGRAKARVEGRGAIQDGALGKPGSDSQAPDAGPRKDHPCYTHRHDN